ncbi:hypothetical protein [Caldifermentibacillus hisashii]|uniref:PTS sugar transporter subunit IIA n=1 Tax=Caldifermentibacillus hisashii TaxID=996558 RepID=UPI002DF82BF4|nr:hypothetical protein [Caldifermentibacillus hisashii]
MRKIILASHGDLSKGMLGAVKMIIGSSELGSNIDAYSLEIGKNPYDYVEKMKEEIKKNPNDEYIFISDIKGGSVHTALTQLCVYKNVKLFSGMNMNMVFELVFYKEKTLTTENGFRLLDEIKNGITFMDSQSFILQGSDEF